MSAAIPAAKRTHSNESALIAVFSAIALLVHLLTNGRYGYFRDELYYIACGRHLAFGYVDQPPLSILLLRLSEAFLGDSLFSSPGGCGDSRTHRFARARVGRAQMGDLARMCGLALRAVQSGSRKF